jgi:hypothetical protein
MRPTLMANHACVLTGCGVGGGRAATELPRDFNLEITKITKASKNTKTDFMTFAFFWCVFGRFSSS